MAAAVAVAGNHPGIDAHCQQQPVQQHSIALADGSSVHQCCIGSIFQPVVRIAQICIVVGNIAAHPVVDGFQGSIGIGRIRIQAGQKGGYRAVHFCFLLGCGVVADIVGVAHVVFAFVGVAGGTVGHIGILPAQIVTFLGVAGMCKGFLKEIIHQGIAVLFHRKLEGNRFSPLCHLLAQIGYGFFLGVAGDCGHRRIIGLRLKGRRAVIQGIGVETGNRLQPDILCCLDIQRRGGQTGKQQRKGQEQRQYFFHDTSSIP